MPGTPKTVDPATSATNSNRQIAAVHTISRLLSSTLDIDERLRDILTVSMDAVNAGAGSILLYRAQDDKLVFQYVVGPKTKELTGFAIDAGSGVAGAVFRSGQPQITNDLRSSVQHLPDVDRATGYQTTNMVSVPLKYRDGKAVGTMQILNKRDGGFDQSDLEVLEIVGSIAASAIENTQLYREAQVAAIASAVGNLSHDIKNKVTPISLSVDTLWPMLDEMYQDIDRAMAQAPQPVAEELRHATEMLRDFYPESFEIIKDQVEEVQAYTKLIADALRGSVSELQLEAHELAPILDRQIESLLATAMKRGVHLVRDYGDVPVCRFDRFLVERAVYNLINNAIPETPKDGRITVRTWVKLEGDFSDGGYLAIEVRDTGCGMPAQVLERVLSGNAKSTKPGGTGLGTRIVYNAASMHGGVFEGESAEGQGTALRIKLPLKY